MTISLRGFGVLVAALLSVAACATSVPEPAAKPPRKMILPNGEIELPARGTFTYGTVRHTCLMDADVAPVDRQLLETTALSYARASLGSNQAEAYAMMSPEARATTSSEGFAAAMGALQRQAGPFHDVRLAHTYVIESEGGGAAEAASCGLLKGRRWVTVELKAERKQAYVAMSARTQNNGWDVIVWLLPDGGKWAVGWSNIGMASTAGRNAEDLLELARKERKAGYVFNAYVLYATLRALVDRGRNFRFEMAQEAAEEFGTLELPPELRGPPPFAWNLKGKEYSVAEVSLLGVNGKLGLVLLLPRTSWTGEAAADKYNREFLTGFIAAHPDYARVFEFLVARALAPDKSMGFATVYELGRGFIKR